MNNLKLFIFSFLFGLSAFAQVHPEIKSTDKPAPSPEVALSAGSYFVMVKKSDSGDKLILKLVDQKKENSHVKDSSVTVALTRKTKTSPKPYTAHLPCQEIQDHFECESVDGNVFVKGDSFKITSTRNKVKGKVLSTQF